MRTLLTSILLGLLLSLLWVMPVSAVAEEDITITVTSGNPEQITDPPYEIAFTVECVNGIASISTSNGNTYGNAVGNFGHRIKFAVNTNGTYTVYVTDLKGQTISKDIVITNLTTEETDNTPPRINITQGNPTSDVNPPYELRFSATDNVALAFVYVNDYLLSGNYPGKQDATFKYTVGDNGTYTIKVIDSSGLETITSVNINKILPATMETQATTQAPTEVATQAPTEATMQAPTETTTQVPTEKITKAEKTETQIKATLKNVDTNKTNGNLTLKNINKKSPLIRVIFLFLIVVIIFFAVMLVKSILRKKDLQTLKAKIEANLKDGKKDEK